MHLPAVKFTHKIPDHCYPSSLCEATVQKFKELNGLFVDHFGWCNIGKIRKTNKLLHCIKVDFKRIMDAMDTNATELKALFGILC